MNDRYNLWESPTLVAAADSAFGEDTAVDDDPTDRHALTCQVWTSDKPCDCATAS